MDMRGYYPIPDEKPLDSIPANGGFCRIFRKIGCIGDSLSSGEFELRNEDGTLYAVRSLLPYIFFISRRASR